jgi:hypothetical protein
MIWTDFMNPTVKGEYQFPDPGGFYINTEVIAWIQTVRRVPLWPLIAWNPSQAAARGIGLD